MKLKMLCKNSNQNYFEDDNKIPKLFSTQMHFLAEKLFELTKSDIQKKMKNQNI